MAWLAVGLLIVLERAFGYAPFMRLWFGSVPLTPRHWLVPSGIGLVVFEVEKALLWRFPGHPRSGAKLLSPPAAC